MCCPATQPRPWNCPLPLVCPRPCDSPRPCSCPYLTLTLALRSRPPELSPRGRRLCVLLSIACSLCLSASLLALVVGLSSAALTALAALAAASALVMAAALLRRSWSAGWRACPPAASGGLLGRGRGHRATVQLRTFYRQPLAGRDSAIGSVSCSDEVSGARSVSSRQPTSSTSQFDAQIDRS